MKVADQFGQVGVLLTEDRFVPVLEKVPVAPVALVKRHGMAGHQPAHHGGYGCFAGSQQQVKVIIHQRPGKAPGLGFNQNARQPLDEILPVRVVAEDDALLDPPGGYVMQRPGSINA